MVRLKAALLLLAALGCGTVQDRTLCTAGSCPAGQYCGPAGACLADVEAPVVGPVVTTPGTVRRDGVIGVRVPVSDDQGVTGVTATLDLPGAPAVALDKGSDGWEGQLGVAALAFPDYARSVAVRVVARDAAGNEGRGSGAVTVTRALWSLEVGARLTAAAVASDGGAIVGVDRGERQLVKVTPAGGVAWEATVGTMGIVGAPGVGEGRVFAGTLEGRAASVDPTQVSAPPSFCLATRPISVPVALRADGNEAYFGSELGDLLAIDQQATCVYSSATANSITNAVLDASGFLYAVSDGYLGCFQVLAGRFYERWRLNPPPPKVGPEVSVPPAIDRTGSIWTSATNGQLNATTSSGDTRQLALLPPGPAGPIILADGSVVLGDGAGIVHRIDPVTGLDRWTSLSLGAAAVTAMALTGTDADLIVPTVDGVLHALRSGDGAEVWRARLSSSGDLKPGNLHTPAGASGSVGYFPSSDGTLRAVLLDGRLDTAAAWPKAFHDVRNTNNAASPLP